MKRIAKGTRKAQYDDLRALFDRFVTVKHIAQKLDSCRDDDDAYEVKQGMEGSGYDFIAIKNSDNVVFGYLQRRDLDTGLCQKYAKHFGPLDLVAESMPLFELLLIFKDIDRVFVLDGNKVSSIVTYADLQKSPVRLLLFGLITILEMLMLDLIREHYSDQSWSKILKPNRLEKCNSEFEKQKDKNEEIDLTSCLQFCDKRVICMSSQIIRDSLGILTEKEGNALLKDIEDLRNYLAHAQEKMPFPSWKKVIKLAIAIDRILKIV